MLLPSRVRKSHRRHVKNFSEGLNIARLMGERREILGRRKDGAEFPGEASISKLELYGNRVFTVIFRDITRRREAEREFAEKSAILETTFESMSRGIVVYNADLTLVAFNQRYLDLWGYPADMICLGMSYEEIARLRAEQGEFGVDDVEKQVRKSVKSMCKGDNLEVVRTTPAGIVLALRRDRLPDGGSVTTFTDITEQKKAAREIAEKSAILETTFENMSQGIRVLDGDLKLVAFNERYVDLWCYPSGFIRLGMSYEEITRFNVQRGIYGPDNVDDHVRQRLEEKRRRELVRREIKLPNGIVVACHHEPMPDGGSVTAYTDITEQEKAEAELRHAKEQAELANRAKSEFLTTMSHELRTPLNAVLGFAEIMEHQIHGPLGHPKYGEYIGDIHESGTHLLELINDILDVSRIETGQIELNADWLDVGVVVESSVRLVREKANQASLELLNMVNDDTLRLFADERRAKQILLNLLSNAVKFTPKGGRVSVDAGIDEGGNCFLSVSDTGVGIAPEDMDKVLSPFGQVDGSLSRRHEGSGLGLPLAGSLVELHGGTLDLDSEPGMGTTVTARFPTKRTARAKEPAATSRATG
jgi:signal transduction histidine kinase